MCWIAPTKPSVGAHWTQFNQQHPMICTALIQTYHGTTDGWQTVTTRQTKREAEHFLRVLSLVRPHYIHKITRTYS